MRILFVTVNGVDDDSYGGGKASRRNYEIMKKYGDTDVITVRKKSNFASAVSILQGCFPPATKRYLRRIKDMLNEKKYDFVFFDGSHFGSFVRYVKSREIKTVCFFHNCEYDYIDVRFGTGASVKKCIYRMLIARQEKMAARCADRNIVFTRRDAERVSSLYSVARPEVIPLSLEDTYEKRQPRERECLLFGAAGQANEEGFGWFVENVSPFLHCATRVAGKGFDAYRDKWSGEKVRVQGYAEDMAQLYADAVCVAIPLLSGGGMKIKTAEALMYGKYIFGTEEAFAGYDLEWGEAAGRCSSAEEFIREINAFLDREPDAFHPCSRQAYLDKYSARAGEKAFDAILRT